MNTEIDNLTMEEALVEIEQLIQKHKKSYVVTPNLDHIVLLEKDEEFAKVYKSADLIVADGKPLIWISKWLRNPIKEKISGSDLFPQMCGMAADRGYTIFILGAAEGIAEKAAENLEQKYPGVKFVGTYSPKYGFETMPDELEHIKECILQSRPDILAVSLGSPKGEKFIFRHLEEYGVPLSISIGATIDFEAGNIQRAPKWMSECGLEWLYRTIKEPRRLAKRYFVDAISIVPIMFKYKRKRK